MSDKTILENNSQENILDNSQTVIEDTSLTVIDSDISLSKKQSFQLETFLNYKVIRQLETEGAEADIYVVTKDDKEYILKLYRYGIEPKQEVVKILLDLSEKFPEDIVKIYKIDFHDDTNRWYEIQEYAKFGSLKDLDTSSLKSSVIKQIVAEINSILSSLHNNGIIHRDLKPANILIRSNSPLDLIMTDFGISSVLDDEMSKKMTSKSGTRIYFAPESFSGVIGKEVDLWAFGIILLELVTGENIFHGINEGLIAYEIHTKGVLVPDNLDTKIAVLLKGLLTRDPKKRWSVKEVEQWLKGKTDIPLHYDYSSETVQGYEKPYVFNKVKYHSLQDLVSAFTKSEENWENGLAHYYRGYVSKWLESNEDFDTSIATDKIKEETEDRDFALLKLINKYSPTLEFIVYGKLINLNNILLYVGKYLNNTASKFEIQIVENLADGNLQEYYDEFCKHSKWSEELTKFLLNISKLNKDLEEENGKQLYIHDIYKYLEVMVKKGSYHFPMGLDNISPDQIISNYENLELLFTKVEFEALETKYLLPLSFSVSLKHAVTIDSYLKAKKLLHEKVLIDKQKFNKINKEIDVLQFFSVSNCCDNDEIYYEVFEFIESGYEDLKNFLQKKEEYILPYSFNTIEKNNLIAVYKKLNFLSSLSKDEFSKYKKNFYLPKELEHLDTNESFGNYIVSLEKWKDLIENDKFIRKTNKLLTQLKSLNIDMKKMFDLRFEFLENTSEYRKVATLLKDYESKLSRYIYDLSDYILPADFEDICKNSPKELLKLLQELIEKKYILPLELQNINQLNSKEYVQAMYDLDELLTEDEFALILQEQELLNYFELHNISKENISYENYIKLVRIQEIISSPDKEKYLNCITSASLIKDDDSFFHSTKKYLNFLIYGKKKILEDDKKVIKLLKDYRKDARKDFALYHDIWVVLSIIFLPFFFIVIIIESFFTEDTSYILLLFFTAVLYNWTPVIYRYKQFFMYKIAYFIEFENYEVKDYVTDVLSKYDKNYDIPSIKKVQKKFQNKLLIGSVLFILLYSISSFYAKQLFPEYVIYKTSNTPYELANKYYNEKDYKKAFELFEKAANQGNYEAQNWLGLMYGTGKGVAQDYKKAVEYYQKSADQNYDWAQNHLANMYYNGIGIKKDHDKAIEWYKRAADQGNTEAQKFLNQIQKED